MVKSLVNHIRNRVIADIRDRGWQTFMA